MPREPEIMNLPALRVPTQPAAGAKLDADTLLCMLMEHTDLVRVVEDAGTGDRLFLLLIGIPAGLFQRLAGWRAEQADMEPDDPPEDAEDAEDDDPAEDADADEDNGDREPVDYLD